MCQWNEDIITANTHTHKRFELSTRCHVIVYLTDTVDLTELEGSVWSLGSLQYCLTKVDENRPRFFQNPSVGQWQWEAWSNAAWKSTDPSRNTGSIMFISAQLFFHWKSPRLIIILTLWRFILKPVCIHICNYSEIKPFWYIMYPNESRFYWMWKWKNFRCALGIFVFILVNISSLNCVCALEVTP